MTFGQLIGRLEGERRVVEIVAILLGYCHASLTEEGAAGGEASTDSDDWATAAQSELMETLDEYEHMPDGRGVHTVLADESVGRIIELLREVPPDVSAAVVASTLARHLDDVWAAEMTAAFTGRDPIRLERGTVYAVQYPSLWHDIASAMGTPPWALPRPLWWAKHLRVASDLPEVYVLEVDYRYDAALSFLEAPGDDGSVATFHPNDTIHEDVGAPGNEFTWEATGAGFRHLRPVDLDRQWDIIHQLLEAAEGCRPAIMVFPELSVDEATASRLGALAGQLGCLVVSGSCHAERDGALVNEVGLYLPEEPTPVLLHRKFNPLQDPRELLADTVPTLRCLVGGGWHTVVCICRDFIDHRTRQAMTALGATMVLVPAMTDDLALFEVYAAEVSKSQQAVVVVANNPRAWVTSSGERKPGRAVLAHPAGNARVMNGTSPAGVAWLKLRTAALSWESLDR